MNFWCRVILFVAASFASGINSADDRNEPVPPKAAAYQTESRAGLSDEALLKFMSPGRNVFEFRREHVQQNKVPDGFWTMPPKEAALALADGSRNATHRSSYPLSADERDGKTPPSSGTVTLFHQSSRCYSAQDWNFEIHFEDKNSWVAFARTAVGGAAFYNPLRDICDYQFIWRSISDTDARQLAHTLWWLERIHTGFGRSKDRFANLAMSSTADGEATLVVKSEASPNSIELEGTAFSDVISARWEADYDDEIALNLAIYLIEVALPERWKEKGLWFQDSPPSWSISDEDMLKARSIQREGLTVSVRDMLRRVVAAPLSLDPLYAELAVRATGDFCLPLKEELDALDRLIKPPTKEELELLALEKKEQPRSRESNFEPDPDYARKAELQKLLRGNLAFALRNALPLARRQLAAYNDARALSAWASTGQNGTTWALNRLHELDPKLEADFLATKLPTLKHPEQAMLGANMFTSIIKANPSLARSLLPKLGPKLRTACLALMPAESGQATDPHRLLAVLTDEKQDWHARSDALDALVPATKPMQLGGNDVDDALVKLLKDKSEFGGIAKSSARKLCLRDRAVNHWKELLEFHNNTFQSEALDGLAWIVSQTHEPKCRSDLLTLLRSHLVQTNLSITTVIDSIYAADLRDLLDDLKSIATRDADDIEGEEAYSSSEPARKITSRIHRARHILAIWEEPDITTRARLLIAWRLGQQSSVWGYGGIAFISRYDEALRAAMSSPDLHRERLSQFIAWCLKEGDSHLASPMSDEDRKWLKGVLPSPP